jgi:hypothetical protein
MMGLMAESFPGVFSGYDLDVVESHQVGSPSCLGAVMCAQDLEEVAGAMQLFGCADVCHLQLQRGALLPAVCRSNK